MDENKTYKHLFFDLDNTLTRSRSSITDEMKKTLSALSEDIIIVTGAKDEQIINQVTDIDCIRMGQNGNYVVKDEKVLWEDTLSDEARESILKHIAQLETVRTWNVTDENDLIEDRGCQISYSPLGHHENITIKEAFDPDCGKRRKTLKQFPFSSQLIDIKIAGTTCFDYIQKGKTKGFNVDRLIKHIGWNKDECTYFGDALFEGGNDESVIGVIDTQSVENPAETLKILKQYFLN